VNGASRQPTSRQNRRPEAANDAGIVRKWRQCNVGMHSHDISVY